MIDGIELFDLSLRVVFDHDFQRTQHRHPAQRLFIEDLANREIEHADIDHAVGLGDADAFDEIADGLGRHAAPAQARDRRHAGIVPTADVSIAHQFGQHALGQHRVGQIEPREFVLMRLRRDLQIGDEPVVKRPMILEFERADRMRDVLDRIRLAVRIVVAWIDLPFRAGARMRWRAKSGTSPDRAG